MPGGGLLVAFVLQESLPSLAIAAAARKDFGVGSIALLFRLLRYVILKALCACKATPAVRTNICMHEFMTKQDPYAQAVYSCAHTHDFHRSSLHRKAVSSSFFRCRRFLLRAARDLACKWARWRHITPEPPGPPASPPATQGKTPAVRSVQALLLGLDAHASMEYREACLARLAGAARDDAHDGGEPARLPHHR
jgi:hypothetical protein